MVKEKGMFKRLLLSIIFAFLFINNSFASGGELICSKVDNANNGFALSSSKDSEENIIIAGYKNISLNDDAFYIAKFSSDCSGILWNYEENPSLQSDRVVSVTTDFEDNIIAVGYYFHGTNVDIKTFKLDKSTGNKIWEERYNGTANFDDYPVSVKTDSLGNIYVAGYSRNSSGNDDFLLIKYHKDGGLPLWGQTFNSVYNGDDRITSLDISSDSVVIAGYSDNGNNLDMLFIKYALTGELLWSRRYIGNANNEDRASSIVIDKNGDIVVTGFTTNDAGNKDIFLGKYYKDTGVPVWEKIYDGSYDEETYAITLDANSDIYLTGYRWTVETHTQQITMKFSSNTGDISWLTGYSLPEDVTTVGTDIAIESDGDLYTTGYLVRGTNYNILTIKFHKDTGNIIWSSEFNGNADKNERPVKVFVGNDGKIIVTGWTESDTSVQHYVFLKYEPGTLNTPTGLTFNLLSNTSVQLNWVDNSSNEDSFKIERKDGDLGNWIEIASVLADTTGYIDNTVSPNAKYFYRVRAYSSSSGYSHYSNEVKVITTIISFEQPSWVYTFNGSGNNDDYVNGIAVGPDSNPAITGFSYSTNSGFDYITMKLNRSNGSLIWSQTYDDPENDTDIATCIDVDSNNNAVVSGFASLFNPNVGYNTNDIMTIKYSSTGDVLWSNAYSGPGNSDDRSVAISVTRDVSNNPYVLGYGKNSNGNDDIYLIKYNSTGTRLWSNIYNGGGDDYPSSFVIDKNGDVVVVGYVTRNGNFDWYISKHRSSDGNVLWTYFYDEAGLEDKALSVAMDNNGDVFVTGFITTAGNTKDIFTIKIAGSTGNVIWQKKLNRTTVFNEGKKVNVDPLDGNVAVTATIQNNDGDKDVYVIKLRNLDGETVWEQVGARSSVNDVVVDSIMDISGNICIAGNSGEGDNQDVIAIKFDHDGNLLGASLYNGAANRQDGIEKIAVNRYGETFLAGYTTTANGNTDFLVFKCGLDPIQVPTPVTLTPSYNTVLINWNDNSFSETGYLIERKTGSCSNSEIFQTVTMTGPDVTTYTDTNLPTDTTFCYRIRTVGPNNFTSREELQIETKTLKPAVPTLTSLQAVDTTTVRLTWIDNTTEETNFSIERCEGAGCEDFELLVNVSSNTTIFDDTTVCNGNTYRYRIYAVKSGYWTTEPSEVLTVTLPTPPASFTLSTTSLSESSIKLDWSDGFVDETGFAIERCEGISCENYTQITTVTANTTTYTDNSLIWGRTYKYRVKAYKSSSCPWYVYSTTSTATTDVQAPASLTSTEVKTTTLKLTWQDKTSTETGFKIYRCLGNSCSDFQEIATVGVNVITYTDTSVCEGMTYRYYVTAYKTGEWESQPSNIIQVTTNAKGSFSSFNAQRLSEMETSLSFSFNSTDLDGFRVERCNSDTCNESDFTLIKTIPSTANTFSDKVNAEQYYTYRIKAFKASTCVWEVVTPTMTVYTELYPPSDISVTPNDTTSALISWIDNTKFESSFDIERCTGTGCSDFTKVGFVNNDITQYTENNTLCAGGTYSFRVKAIYNNFKNSGGGCWKRRSKLNITNFAEDTQTKVIVSYKAGMKADFSDIRFFDETAGIELPYWIESKTDNSSATVWLKTGSNNSIYLYYDNSLAISPNYTGKDIFEFFEGFDGTAIDTNIWNINSSNYSLSGGVLRINTGAFRTKNPLPFNLNSGYILEGRVLYYSDTDTYKYSGTLTGVSTTYTSVGNSTGAATVLLMRNSSYNPYNRDLYYFIGDGSQNSYNHGSVKLLTTTANTWYIYSEKFLPNGLIISVNNTDSLTKSFTWAKEPKYITIGVFDGSGGDIQDTGYDWIRVRKYVSPEPSVTIGTEEYDGNCLSLNITPWEKTSTEVSVTMGVPASPVISATGISEANIRIDISDTNIDETGFTIYRCVGTTCNPTIDGSVLQMLPPNSTNYVDTVTSGSYTYSVVAYKTEVCPWEKESNIVSASTILPPPPGSLITTVLSTTEIKLNWIDTTGSEDGFNIYRCIGSGCSDYTLLVSVPANTVTYTDNTLCMNTTAKYRITAYKSGAWETGFSNEVTVTTQTPATPTLTGTKISETQINLSWTDGNSDETGFEIWRCTGTGCDPKSGSMIASLGANVTTYSNTSLTANTTYRYLVIVYKNVSGCSGGRWTMESNVVEVTTDVTPPSGLTATAANTTQVNLTWTDNTSSEDGFNIYRCAGTGCSDYILITTKTANTTSHSDNTVCKGATYRYKITSYKSDAWETGFSNEVTVTTQTPATPTLTGTKISETQINLSWTDGNSDETGFEIWRCTGTGCDPKSGSMIASLGANVTTYSNTSLTANTTYRYLVIVYKNVSGCSGGRWTMESNVVEVTTDVTPPSGLTATAANTTQVNLTWTDNTSSEDGFNIYRCAGTGCSDYILITTKTANTTSHSDNTVCKGATYRYKITSYKSDAWETGFSNEVTVTTPDIVSPQKTSLTVLSHISIKINWVDDYTDETGFTLKTCSDGNCSEENISANATEVIKTNLNRFTDYCFSIKAYNNALCSWETPYSEEACAKTLLEAPLAINAIAVSSRKVKITWLNPNSDVDGFDIEVMLWNNKWVKAGRVYGNTIEFIDKNGVQPDMNYRYRIKAFKGDSYSLPSNEVTVTTPSWTSGDDVCE